MKTNRTVTTLLGIALLPVLFGGLQAAHAQGETTVQEDANKTVVRRLVDEVKNRNNPAAAEELFSPDYVHHFNFPGVETAARPGRLCHHRRDLWHRLPRNRGHPRDLDRRRGVRARAQQRRGPPRWEFLGIPATNQTVTWTENHLYRIVDGRIVEHWPEVDIAGLLEQMGVFPAR